MKAVIALFSLIATAALTQAGGFGGPPPFTNDSPLVSGVDGSYQASARGTNLTGIIRFSYFNGLQATNTSTSGTGSFVIDPYNDYVFFVNGLVFRGIDQVNINGKKLTGILDNGKAVVLNFSTVPGTDALFPNICNGFFNGSFDVNSPNYSFSGSGTFVVIELASSVLPTTILGTTTYGFKFTGIRASLNLVPST